MAKTIEIHARVCYTLIYTNFKLVGNIRRKVKNRMKKQIAILGFGVVGGGCADVLYDNKQTISKKTGFDIEVKYILDLRDFPDSPHADKVVHDINIILDDPEVELVCEMMGGSHPALEFSLAAMNRGKHVVTSNKEVVSVHGIELLAAAKKNNVKYMFEASVGGGIPVIHTIDTSLAQNNISEIDGILNGTTNYILTRMNTAGVSFDEALAEAKSLGYAEANPSADVDGIDACRKICILAALAFGKLPNPESTYAEGIRNITSADVDNAAKLGGTIKLIGRAFADGDRLGAYVCPMVVKNNNPLSTVSDVFNGIKIDGDKVGEVMLYGRGAGKLPTASAVVADVINILTGNGVSYDFEAAEDKDVVPFAEVKSARMIATDKKADGLKEICDCLYVTEEISESEYAELEDKLSKSGIKVLSAIRILK